MPPRMFLTRPTGNIKRIIVLVVLLALMAVGVGLLLGTQRGELLLHHPNAFGKSVQAIVARHKFIAPAIFIAFYICIALLALPMWWLDLLAGFGFGIFGGIFCCEIGGTIGAALTLLLSRWLAGEWVQKRLEGRIERLRRLDEKLDHNGFLVVMAVRLCHVAPFGLSNYLFGMIRIPLADIIVGTLLGSLPVNTVSVTVGAEPGAIATSSFIAMLIVMHVLLLIPLALRYIRPQWFKRIGVE